MSNYPMKLRLKSTKEMGRRLSQIFADKKQESEISVHLRESASKILSHLPRMLQGKDLSQSLPPSGADSFA